VLAVDEDLDRDLLHVKYDPTRISPPQMQALLDRFDVGGQIVEPGP
jgi:hypothetical protein